MVYIKKIHVFINHVVKIFVGLTFKIFYTQQGLCLKHNLVIKKRYYCSIKMGHKGKQQQAVKRMMKEFPAALAAQAHRPVMNQLWDIYEQFKGSSSLQRSLVACVIISMFTVTFRWGSELGAGLTGFDEVTVKSICRFVALFTFFFIRDSLVFPFNVEFIKDSLKEKVLTTLLNELMRIILQCTTAYMCGYDHTSTVLITALWCIVSIMTTLSVLDFSVYDRVLYHSDTNIRDLEPVLTSGLLDLKNSMNFQFKIFSIYVWAQYILYVINTVFSNQVSIWLLGSFPIFLAFRYIHVVCILGLIFNLFRLHHARHLAHQIYNIQMIRFCLLFITSHMIGGFVWMYLLQPRLKISLTQFNISCFWIATAGCLSLLSIATNELKSIIPGASQDEEDKNDTVDDISSSSNRTITTNNKKKNRQSGKDDKNVQKNKPNKSGWITVQSEDNIHSKVKVKGGPYIIEPSFPTNNILVKLYTHLLLLQLESRFSPTIQNVYYICLFLGLTPLFLWTQHIVWIIGFLVIPL